MRILLVSIYFPPDVNSTGALMWQLSQTLLAKGHQVSVITSFPHYEKLQIWEEYRGRLFERVQHEGIDVLRLWNYARGNKSNMLNRLLSYLSFNILATVTSVMSRARWDIVLCTNGSFFSGITGWLIGQFKAIPFVYNVQDLYPDVPVQAGLLRNRHAVATLRRIEQFMYKKASHVTVISPSMRQNLLDKGVPKKKVTVIPNFVDTDFIRPLPKVNFFSERYGLSQKFVVMHAGNLGYVYDSETMLRAAALVANHKDILFLIVGNGVVKPQLERKARALHLENVRFLPFQPLEILPWLRASSDVQVSLYKKGSVKYSMPSKIYEIMASGRPVLASADEGSDVWELTQGIRCGVCVEPENPKQLAEAILMLCRSPSMRQRMGQNGRRCAEQSYSRKAVVRCYEHLLQRILL